MGVIERFSASSTFLDGDDLHSFIRPAIQARVMGKFLFMALRADRKARGSNSQLLGSPFVSTRSRYFVLWIWHGLPRFSIYLYLSVFHSLSVTLISSAVLARWKTGLCAALQYSDTNVHFDPDHRLDRGQDILRDTMVASGSIR